MPEDCAANERTLSPIEPLTTGSREYTSPIYTARARQSGPTYNPFLGEPSLPPIPSWESGEKTALSNMVLNGLEEKLRAYIDDTETRSRALAQLRRLRDTCSSGDLNNQGVVTGVRNLALTLPNHTGEIVTLQKERSLLCKFLRREHEMHEWERNSTYVPASSA